MNERLGPIEAAVETAAADLVTRRAVWRAFAADHTLWQEDPTEVADRLGWLFVAAEMADEVSDLDAFARGCAADGLTHVVLMGMGGSSLFPEVLATTFGTAPGYLRLQVLDTTDPAAIRRTAAECPPASTLYVAASKSGGTIETLSHLAFFWDRVGRPEQFAAITDPGSSLAELARQRGFRRVFENRPDIGGRYSALSYFGMVPGALIGADLGTLLGRAGKMVAAMSPDADASTNPGLRLGAIMGAAALQGRDKLTLVLPGEVSSFGAWLEQLIAESTGKRGKGILPVDGEEVGPPGVYGHDRLFVSLGPDPRLDALAAAGHPVVELPYDGALSIGDEVMRWEMATALAGAVLGINPFDQPNVAEAKAATERVLKEGLRDIPTEPLAPLLDQLRPGDYLAIQAFVDPGSPVVERLQAARLALRDRYHVATTLGLGPRYLHSTGQLHKGGARTGVFVQIVGPDESELPIPGREFGFSTLKRAQAAGDLTALRNHGLRAARVAVEVVLKESS